MQDEIKLQLDRQLINLIRNPKTVFFSTVAMNLVQRLDDHINAKDEHGNSVNIPIQTACTDYRQVIYNPKFFASLSSQEQFGLVVHELLHVVLKHKLRLGNRNKKVWGKATDYEINLIIDDMGITLPPNPLLNRSYTGMSAEAIYESLIAEGEPLGEEDDPHFIAGVGESPDEIAKEEIFIDNMILKAAQAAEGFTEAYMPGQIVEIIQKVKSPPLDPLRVLGNFLSSSFGFQCYNYAKPHKKSSDEMYLPSRRKKRVKHVMYFLDTSGSVEEEHFAAYRAAIELTHRRLSPLKATLLLFDRKINEEYNITSLNQLQHIPMVGRGGTSVFPVMELIKEAKPDLAIIFTDGDFRMPSEPTTARTIWYINDRGPNFQIPAELGITINYETPGL